MKLRIFFVIMVATSFSLTAYSQDSTKRVLKPRITADSIQMHKKKYKNMHAKTKIYRDTRLGSSEKKYDTYKKNDNGAGSVTTSPKKERP